MVTENSLFLSNNQLYLKAVLTLFLQRTKHSALYNDKCFIQLNYIQATDFILITVFPKPFAKHVFLQFSKN